MYQILNKKEYPSFISSWKHLDYQEWVKRSFLTNLMSPEEFAKNTSESLKLPKPLTPSLFSHHFSGHLEKKDRIVCFLLNPRLDVHSYYEFFRIISQTGPQSSSVDYSQEIKIN